MTSFPTVFDFTSHWMILDVFANKWTVHAEKHSWITEGSLVTVRGFHYFFYQLFHINDYSNPIISRILEDGTVLDLEIAKPPFEENYEEFGGSYILAPFYQRFYKRILTNF